MRNLCKNSPRTRKKSRQRIKCFKQKLWTILRYRKRFFLFWRNLKNVGLRAKNVCWLLSEVIFWPKLSFCNRASLRFFMHMKTHFSTISFYLNLQIKFFWERDRLIYILLDVVGSIADTRSQADLSTTTTNRPGSN